MQDTSETAKLSERVVKEFFKKKFGEGLDELKKYWPANKAEVEDMKDMTTKTMEKAMDVYGEFIAYQLLSVKNTGDFLREEIYVIRMEYHILRFNFIYYKNNKGWIVNNFTWDDKITELIK